MNEKKRKDMKLVICVLGIWIYVAPVMGQEQLSFTDDAPQTIIFKVDIVENDNLYLVKFEEKNPMFYLYIISGEPIPEINDKELFINIVDAAEPGWPVEESGYIDTRYGVNEFSFDLQGKNFYLMGTNGKYYSDIGEYNFHSSIPAAQTK